MFTNDNFNSTLQYFVKQSFKTVLRTLREYLPSESFERFLARLLPQKNCTIVKIQDKKFTL